MPTWASSSWIERRRALSLIEIDLRPDRATLRTFGWISLAAFALLALFAWQGWLVFGLVPASARVATGLALGAVGLLAGALSVVWPAANRPLYVALTLLALPIGFVLSYVIMGLLFYAVITPIGIVLRLLGRDPLEHELDPSAETYWVDTKRDRPRASYFRQF